MDVRTEKTEQVTDTKPSKGSIVNETGEVIGEWGTVDPSDVMTLRPEEDQNYWYKGSISGPKWAGIEALLHEVVFFEDGIELTMTAYKGWLRQTVLYEIRGPKGKVLKAQQQIDDAVKEWMR
jgi:hypothetical protein